MCVLSESVTSNDSGKCVLDALEPIPLDIFVWNRRQESWHSRGGSRQEPYIGHIVSNGRTIMAEWPGAMTLRFTDRANLDYLGRDGSLEWRQEFLCAQTTEQPATDGNCCPFTKPDPHCRPFGLVFTARCTIVQSAVLRSHVVRLSVRPSVRL